jgi:hypothetical protein
MAMFKSQSSIACMEIFSQKEMRLGKKQLMILKMTNLA